MKIIVQKYGGTSVANTVKIKAAAKRIANAYKKGNRVVVVVSALGHTTDELVELCGQITDNPSRREMDMLLSTGEQISTALMSMALHELKVGAVSLTGFQVGIQTDSSHTKARIQGIDIDRMQQELRKNKVVVVAGFQGVNADKEITTLGRGGSDLTAVALAKVLKADVCEIYTDVEGIFTTDPRIFKGAKKISKISYEEMLELAAAGAGVMQPRSIELAGKFDIPIHVRSSASSKTGTFIVKGDKSMEEVLVRGVSVTKNESKITLVDVSDRPGVAGNIFRAIAKAGINVDMIVQNIGVTDKKTDISFTLPKEDLKDALKVISQFKPKIPREHIIEDKDVAKISIVGIGMRSHSGVAADMFEVLGKNKINIDMISTSEIKISCIVKKKDADKAVKVLHQHFIKSGKQYVAV
ncbi:MAG: aspartate kinase [Candidatus Omnitrophica bacterium]|nr:aspartate kinase [Candidatus Omnitrophota bacterium]